MAWLVIIDFEMFHTGKMAYNAYWKKKLEIIVICTVNFKEISHGNLAILQLV